MNPSDPSHADAVCEQDTLCRALAEAILRHASGNRVVAKAFAGEFATDVLAQRAADVSNEEVELWLDDAARRVLEIPSAPSPVAPDASISDVRAPMLL